MSHFPFCRSSVSTAEICPEGSEIRDVSDRIGTGSVVIALAGALATFATVTAAASTTAADSTTAATADSTTAATATAATATATTATAATATAAVFCPCAVQSRRSDESRAQHQSQKN